MDFVNSRGRESERGRMREEEGEEEKGGRGREGKEREGKERGQNGRGRTTLCPRLVS